ncbi:copper homeostasis protein CutC [Sporosarcina koreensis]|uniref:copper homeostasis protein CutC n=1 Tax=Sporosarcina koreensis TaxID=334735 RepID=UPI00058D90CE|nr:copper homeostasis protein CutC [Sporosarcina koreensis]
MKLEIIASSVEDARTAEAAGADRLELCAALSEGGLTPSRGLIEAVVQAVSIPVHVIVRPHSHSFCYTEDDLDVMLRDIHFIRESDAAGIVIGMLTDDGCIDTDSLERCLTEAGGLSVTFHRAFDEVPDQLRAAAVLAGYPQVQRILTSGGQPTALLGARIIRELTEQTAGTGLTILAGSGLGADGLEQFIRKTGVREVHIGSAVREKQSYCHPIDPGQVKAARRQLDQLSPE